MIRLVLFVLLSLIFGILFFSKTKTLSKKIKIALGVVFGLLLVVGYMHEVKSAEEIQQNQATLNAFKQGKILLCRGVEINKESFIYMSGTLSFVPNNANTKQKGLVVELQECSVK